MAGRIQGRLFRRPAAFARQCMAVVLAVMVVAQPVWAAGPVAPQLSSKPGAAYTLFINFSGFTWNQGWGGGGSGPVPGVVPSYNSDGDYATFSGTEMARIHEIWSRASEKYAAFDVNLTTVDPASAGLSDYDRQVYYASIPRFQHTVIGGNASWAGGGTGVSYVDTAQYVENASNAAWKLNWVFPESQIGNNSQGIAEIIAHENGHALGLGHQSDVNIGPALVNQYSSGTSVGGSSYGPIMGSSRGVTRGLWSRGYDNNLNLVNEIGHMLTANSGFAVVDDGVGHTTGTATSIKAINGTVDFTTTKGVITTAPGGTNPDPTNAAHYTNDYWSFTTTGGNVMLNVMSGRSTMNPGLADPGRMLDAALTIYASDGTTVVTSNATWVAGSFDATVSQNLAAGTYYAKVTPTLGSTGTGEVDTDFTLIREFFDIGSYFVTGTIPGLSSDTTRYWDNNGSTAGFGTASGTWAGSTTGNSSQGWSGNSTGNVVPNTVSVDTVDNVHFGTATNGLAAGTVTVSGSVSANRITFGSASGNITLSGGTVALASMSPTITVDNATSTFASVVAGNAGITKAGNGTLVFSSANTLSGNTTINGGTLKLTGNGSLSDLSAVNTAASGTSFDISGITATSETVGSIAGNASSTIVLGAKNLTVQGATATAATTTFAGVISGSGGSLTKIGADTLVLNGNNTYTGGTNIAGGTLQFNSVGLASTSGNITFTGPGRLQWNGHTQDLSSRIVMTNGVTATIDTNNQNVTFVSAIGNSSTGGLTKAGGGALTLSAASTYNGTTTVNGGVLLLNHASALPGGTGATGGTSALTFTGGVLGLGVGDFTRDLATAGTVTGVNFTNAGGWAAYNADRVVNLNNDGHQIVWGTANTGFNGQTVILGATNATHKVTLQNGLNLGSNANRTVQAENGAASIDGELSGVITGSTGGNFTKTGSGTLALTNTNTYIGATTVSGGTLEVSVIANGGANSNIGASSNASANLVLNGGTLRYTGSAVSTDRGFTLSNNSGLDASGNGTISFTNTATPAFGSANATRTLTLSGTNTGNNTLAANLANNGTGAISLTKNGTGSWVVTGSNTHTGVTTVNGGTLAVSVMANGGSVSGIGASASSASSVLLSNGTTFRYSGAADAATDRAFTINGTSDGHGATIESSGAGTLSFNTPATALGYGSGNQARILTLGGTNTGVNTFGKTIVNNGVGITSLVKSGAGRWVLDQTNTYTGLTTVSGGSLVIAGSGSINNSSAINVAAGAQLVYNSSTALTRAPSLAGSLATPAILSGNGTISAALTLDNLGDVLSPGNSPGVQSFGVTQTWNSFTYAWEVNDWTTAVVGTNFDRIGITGGLSLSGSTYELDLFSLTALNASGNLSNFSEVSRSWTIVSTTTGISGFLSSEWNIDFGGFSAASMPLGTWSLGLANGNNDLLLSYAPVPEPGVIAILVAGLAAAWHLRRKNRTCAADHRTAQSVA